jgi:hypothetical protein
MTPTTDRESTGMHQLAGDCSLCGEGYHPHMDIDISATPMERGYGDTPQKTEYRWCHVQCRRDHGRVFLEAFGP